jgi:hypothetical protein
MEKPYLKLLARKELWEAHNAKEFASYSDENIDELRQSIEDMLAEADKNDIVSISLSAGAANAIASLAMEAAIKHLILEKHPSL